MSKAQVLRRSFSVFTRVPSSRIVRSAARDGHEHITIHRVRIRKPFLSRQRLVGALAIATATYGLGQYLGLEVEIEEVEADERKPGRWKKQVRKEDGTLEEVDDEEANAEEEDEDEEEEEEEAILFLPTGLSRAKPREFYKGTDPEWQEFKKLAQDGPRIVRIRQDLVDQVRKSYSQPKFQEKIGDIDHSRGRAWVEIKYPDGPPREYERPGYELTQDLEWRKTTRDVAPIVHYKLGKVLYPQAAATALYEDTKRRAERSWNDISAYMGWAEETSSLTLQQGVVQIGNGTPPTSAAATTTTSTTTTITATPASTFPPPSPSPSSKETAGIALPPAQTLTLDLTQFRTDFRAQYLKGAQFVNVPRGALGVYALVEVCGSKVRLVLNVTGVYDPKSGKWVGLYATPWNSMAVRQAPRG